MDFGIILKLTQPTCLHIQPKSGIYIVSLPFSITEGRKSQTAEADKIKDSTPGTLSEVHIKSMNLCTWAIEDPHLPWDIRYRWASNALRHKYRFWGEIMVLPCLGDYACYSVFVLMCLREASCFVLLDFGISVVTLFMLLIFLC